MSKVCVVDSSCLIALWKIAHIDLLRQMFAQVIVPESVQKESDIFCEWFEVRLPQNTPLVRSLCAYLGKGEAETIALGVEIGECEVLLDDRKARKTAEVFSLRVVGTVGLLLRAKRHGYLPHVKPLLDQLVSDGFYLSQEIYAKALEIAEEGDLYKGTG